MASRRPAASVFDGRRACLRRGAAAAGVMLGGTLFTGCGFTLRGALPMPFRSVALVGFAPQSPLERALRAQLALGAELVQPAQAQVVLQALQDVRERAAVATTAAGQVRELQLRARLRWRASTPKGRELVMPSEILLTRDMSFNESAALAKEKEAEQLYAAMDEDIASQVMQRLARIKMEV